MAGKMVFLLKQFPDLECIWKRVAMNVVALLFVKMMYLFFLIEPRQADFSEIPIKFQQLLFENMHLINVICKMRHQAIT